MYVLIRRSTLPRLHLVPGAVARIHDDRITWMPLSNTQETVMTAESLPGGSYGVILNANGRLSILAQYPTLWQARRQLRQLAGGAGWRWIAGLWRVLLVGALLLWVWFLFFLPGDPSARSAHRPAVGAVSDDPVAIASAPQPDGPAFIDDPMDRTREPAARTLDTESGPGSGPAQ